MARPKKQEVDYFPHYCDHGRVLFILESHYKNDGYAVFYKLEEVLGKTEGHCYDCAPVENWEYLLSRMGTTEEIVLGVLEKLASMSVIDPALWAKKKIWMESFVQSISHVYARRRSNIPTQRGLCQQKPQQDDVTDNENPHSIVKYSIKKESKKKEPIVFFENRFLNIPDYLKEKWKLIAPGISLDLEITKAEAWVLSNPKLKKSNWSRFLTNWIVRAQDHVVKYGGNGNLNQINHAQGAKSPYVECPRCKAEVFRDNFIEMGGVKYCPKCPEIQKKDKAETKKQYEKLAQLAAGVGKPVPAARR